MTWTAGLPREHGRSAWCGRAWLGMQCCPIAGHCRAGRQGFGLVKPDYVSQLPVPPACLGGGLLLANAPSVHIRHRAGPVLRSVRTAESNLGNFIADVWREACHADVALCNGGTFRSGAP